MPVICGRNKEMSRREIPLFLVNVILGLAAMVAAMLALFSPIGWCGFFVVIIIGILINALYLYLNRRFYK
jgi:uncharacterized membrane protein YjjP (DUF1212 family)